MLLFKMSNFVVEFNKQITDIQKLILSYFDDYVFRVIVNTESDEDFENFVINYSSWVLDMLLHMPSHTPSYMPSYMVPYKQKHSKNIFKYAALSGDIKLLKYLLSNNFFKDEETFSAAAKNGNLDNMKW